MGKCYAGVECFGGQRVSVEEREAINQSVLSNSGYFSTSSEGSSPNGSKCPPNTCPSAVCYGDRIDLCRCLPKNERSRAAQ